MKVYLRGLTCANCAGKIEGAVGALQETQEANINLMKQTLEVSLQADAEEKNVFEKIEKIVHKFEPQVQVALESEAFSSNLGSSCTCCDACVDRHEHEQSHNHGHTHNEQMDATKLWIRFGIGGILFLLAIFLQESHITLALFLLSYGIFGYDVLSSAFRNILRGQVFDENFLMSLSTVGAIAIGEMPEAVFVMMFYQVGEAFQDYAVQRSRKSITALLDIRPDFAEVVTEKGVQRVSPEEVNIGDIILVKAGERIPLDGKVKEGHALLDTAALTGEALPREAEPGSEVLSGCINLNGNLKILVSKPFGESTVMKILEMVENAAGKKSKTERFITRFAKIYTPVVVGLAVALAVIPPVLGFGPFQMWFGRALIFLVVSCPCALVLSVPLSYFAGIGAASKNGILVKGGGDLDTLCHVHQIVFDKTGTLTKGKFSVTEMEGQDKEELLYLAALGEANSNHPIAQAIVREFKKTKELPKTAISGYQERGGLGILYSLNGEEILLGNQRLMEKENIEYIPFHGVGSVVYVAKSGVYKGYIAVADTLKDGCAEALAVLRNKGIESMVMLTGDRKKNAEAMARELGLNKFYADLLPGDKVHILEDLKEKGTSLSKTAFVGDGINDAPVLAGADLGIAMGGIGSDAAIEAADVVLMDDDIGKLAAGIRIAKNTRKIVRQNIAFALGIKVLVLILSAIGLATMWMAVFADVGVAVLAILNAMRKK